MYLFYYMFYVGIFRKDHILLSSTLIKICFNNFNYIEISFVKFSYRFKKNETSLFVCSTYHINPPISPSDIDKLSNLERNY